MNAPSTKVLPTGAGGVNDVSPPSVAPARPVADSRLLVLCSCRRWLAWDDLPSRGLQDDGDGGQLELKNCPHCRSTRAVQLRGAA